MSYTNCFAGMHIYSDDGNSQPSNCMRKHNVYCLNFICKMKTRSLIYFKSASISRSVGLPSTIYVYEPLPDVMEIRPGFRMLVPTAPHQEDCFIRDIAVIRYVRPVRGDLMVPHSHYYFWKRRSSFRKYTFI